MSASASIQEKGRLVTFQMLERTPAVSSEPWDSAAQVGAATSLDSYAVFVPAFSASSLGITAISEDLLKRVEQVLIVAPDAAGTDFEIFNSVLDKGVRWGIEWCQTLQPGDDVLLYYLGVRR